MDRRLRKHLTKPPAVTKLRTNLEKEKKGGWFCRRGKKGTNKEPLKRPFEGKGDSVRKKERNVIWLVGEKTF